MSSSVIFEGPLTSSKDLRNRIRRDPEKAVEEYGIMEAIVAKAYDVNQILTKSKTLAYALRVGTSQLLSDCGNVTALILPRKCTQTFLTYAIIIDSTTS